MSCGILGFELKKILSPLFIAILIILCAAEFFICKYLYTASSEDINVNIYKEYIGILSELSPDELAEYIEAEEELISDTLGAEGEMSQKYMTGEIADSEYLEYRDLYKTCSAKEKTFEYIMYKYDRLSEDERLSFTYDLELEGFLTQLTADFPLIIVFIMSASAMFIPETASDPFIRSSKNGRSVFFRVKLFTYFTVAISAILLFNLSELAALFQNDLGDLNAAAASIDSFSGLDADISCIGLIVRIYLMRFFGELTAALILFALSFICKLHITLYTSAVIVLVIPAFLTNALPSALQGLIPYYLLDAKNAVINENLTPAVIGIAVWSLCSVGAAIGQRRYR